MIVPKSQHFELRYADFHVLEDKLKPSTLQVHVPLLITKILQEHQKKDITGEANHNTHLAIFFTHKTRLEKRSTLRFQVQIPFCLCHPTTTKKASYF